MIPQSTVISRPVPRSASFSHVLVAQPVAVGDPVGDQPVAVGAEVAQGRDHQRRRAHPVDVEVAVHGDPLAGFDRRPDQRDDLVHPLERLGRVRLVGGEEGAGLVGGPVAAPDQGHGDGLAQAERVGDGAGLGVVIWIGGERLGGFRHVFQARRRPAANRRPSARKMPGIDAAGLRSQS